MNDNEMATGITRYYIHLTQLMLTINWYIFGTLVDTEYEMLFYYGT